MLLGLAQDGAEGLALESEIETIIPNASTM